MKDRWKKGWKGYEYKRSVKAEKKRTAKGYWTIGSEWTKEKAKAKSKRAREMGYDAYTRKSLAYLDPTLPKKYAWRIFVKKK